MQKLLQNDDIKSNAPCQNMAVSNSSIIWMGNTEPSPVFCSARVEAKQELCITLDQIFTSYGDQKEREEFALISDSFYLEKNFQLFNQAPIF